MVTFKERLGKPSAAIQAMIDGLREIAEEGVVSIDMEFYATSVRGRCVVCAATAAALRATETPAVKLRDAISPETPGGWGLMANVMGTGIEDLREFETAMDMLRRGDPGHMLRYFEVPADSPAYTEKHKWHLDTHTWYQSLDHVEKYRDQLIEMGL